MQYLEITNISLLESALNQEDYFEDFDRDEGSLIKTTTCVQLSAAFVWKYNLKTYTIRSTEWYWFEARYFFEWKKIDYAVLETGVYLKKWVGGAVSRIGRDRY